jgi:hypothetical protein
MNQKMWSNYKGWTVMTIQNRWLTLLIAPQLGGRIIQVEMGGYEYLFNNPSLAGFEPDHTRLGENGSWLNFGGEKVWPAPQGWNSPDQWPGPPDPVLDSGIYAIDETDPSAEHNVINLTSPYDPFTGLQITRKINLEPAFSVVSITVSFQNRGKVPRKWSVWPVCQFRIPEGESLNNHRVICPVHPDSRFVAGYKVMHGLVNNPQYRFDDFGNFEVNYDYLVGKAGLDTNSDWIAYLNKKNGKVFVLMFCYEDGKSYPEDTSVQIWTQGKGLIFSRNRIAEYKDDKVKNPPYIEMELVSPLYEIPPGGEYKYEYQMFACTIPQNSGIQTVNRYGVISSQLKMERIDEGILVTAKYGFFVEGIVKLQLNNTMVNSGLNHVFLHEIKVTPLEGLDLKSVVKEADGWFDWEISCKAELFDTEGHFLCEIDKINEYEQF